MATSRAIADGAVALLGTASSGFTIAMNEVAAEKEYRRLQTFQRPVGDSGNDIAFRSCFIDLARVGFSKFAIENLGAKTSVLLVDISTDYPVGWQTISAKRGMK